MSHSLATFLFLSKFLKPQQVDGSRRIGGYSLEEWRAVLGNPPTQVFRRFLSDGLVERATLSEHLSHRYKVSDLKELLKQYGLSVSGRKTELVARLIQHDVQSAREAVKDLMVFQCTEQGRNIAEKYLTREKTRRAQAEQAVWDALKKHEFKNASHKVAEFEASQIFPRGMGVDWANFDHSRNLEMLNWVFKSFPEALKQLPLNSKQIEQCRVVTAMSYLWGNWNSPEEFRHTNSPLWKATGILSNHAYYQKSKSELQIQGAKFVTIVGYGSQPAHCTACHELTGQRFRIEEVPELPYSKCTGPFGCRCSLEEAKATAAEVSNLVNGVARQPTARELAAIKAVFSAQKDEDLTSSQEKVFFAYFDEVLPLMVKALDSKFGRPCWTPLFSPTFSDSLESKEKEFGSSLDILYELLKIAYASQY